MCGVFGFWVPACCRRNLGRKEVVNAARMELSAKTRFCEAWRIYQIDSNAFVGKNKSISSGFALIMDISVSANLPLFLKPAQGCLYRPAGTQHICKRSHKLYTAQYISICQSGRHPPAGFTLFLYIFISSSFSFCWSFIPLLYLQNLGLYFLHPCHGLYCFKAKEKAVSSPVW